MRKALIATIITSVIVFFIGGILFTIGLVSGGRPDFNIDYANHRVFTQDNLKMVTMEESLSDFKNIKIDADAYDVTLKYGDSFGVKYGAYESSLPEIEVSDDTLSITSKQKEETFKLNLFSLNDDNKMPYIEITVPESTELGSFDADINAGAFNIADQNIGKINLNTNAGNVILNNIKSDEFIIKTNAGNVNLKKSEVKVLNIEANAGNIVLKDLITDDVKMDLDYGNLEINDGEIKTLNVEANAGKIDIDDTKADNITVDSDYGKTEISLIGEEDDYDFDIDVDYGELSVNGKDKGNKYSSSNGKDKKIKVSSDAGDVDIKFN